MIGALLAYDVAGNVVATLDALVQLDVTGIPLGLVDFAAHEAAGGEHTDIWSVSNAVGSKVWPEWLGGRAHDFRVELEGPPGHKRIARLIHRSSGHVRERRSIEEAIAGVRPDEHGRRDVRHLVGGPDRPLPLEQDGRTAGRQLQGRPPLPLISLR